jgi:hypothetical protein
METETNTHGNWKPETVVSTGIYAEQPRANGALTEVRVERVQDISEEDAIAEGVEWHNGVKKWRSYDLKGQTPFLQRTAVSSYQTLWDSINVKKHPWSSNPFVWALTFKVLPEERRGR